jgi:hypothetical protein
MFPGAKTEADRQDVFTHNTGWCKTRLTHDTTCESAKCQVTYVSPGMKSNTLSRTLCTIIRTDGVSQTQLVNVLFYLQDIIHSQVMFDSLYLSV